MKESLMKRLRNLVTKPKKESKYISDPNTGKVSLNIPKIKHRTKHLNEQSINQASSPKICLAYKDEVEKALKKRKEDKVAESRARYNKFNPDNSSKRIYSNDIYITREDFERTKEVIPGYYTMDEDGVVKDKEGQIMTITN